MLRIHNSDWPQDAPSIIFSVLYRDQPQIPFNAHTPPDVPARPRLSLENRPYVISSKPANGIGLRRDCFTVPRWA
jgi:hypothetical protein